MRNNTGSNSNYFLGQPSNQSPANTVQKPKTYKIETYQSAIPNQYKTQSNAVVSQYVSQATPLSKRTENDQVQEKRSAFVFGSGGNQDRHHQPEGKKEKEENGYNPLKIPADWELARKHALARRVSKEQQKDPNDNKERETCPCCGYEVQRDLIPYDTNVMELGFLGSGYPLFYNFITYCIFLLFVNLTIKGGFNLLTNVMGGYCEQVFPLDAPSDKVCPNKWVHLVSLANKLDNPQQLEMQENLGVILVIVTMMILIFFRASQRQIDEDIDASVTSPADYTICVKNIPKNLDVDYKKEIKTIFTEFAIPKSNQAVVVTKIVLVHDIEEVIELEVAMDTVIKRKQNHLHENYCNFHDEKLEEYDKIIEEIEEKIHHVEHELEETNKKFTGIAFVSFQTEAMKVNVMEANPWGFFERLNSYFHNGKLPNLPEDSLAWEGYKLFIEQAPEPNDVDWEFIHCSTKDKLKGRFYSYSLSSLFVMACFLLLYVISFWKAKLSDKATEEAKAGEIDPSTLMKVNILSFIVSWTIVLFNKFVIAKVPGNQIIYLDLEKISNKTKFNISYAQKLSVALFLNTAVLSYIIDIMILKNIIGEGGFIQNESQVFILNALFPPFVWLIDPWSIQKDYSRNQEQQDITQSVVTQAEANFISESPDYLQSKRYADIMKTMWFTFLYGTAIPLGIFFSIIGLTIYYYVDKYNLLRRRTIKESLGKDLSLEMIEMLEYILLFNGFGSLTMALNLFGEVHWQDTFIMVISIIYCLLPMQSLADWLFPVKDIDEDKPYSDAELEFDTDYDRENPVTKTKSLKRWKEQVADKKKYSNVEIGHNLHHQIKYDSQNEGYKEFFNHQ